MCSARAASDGSSARLAPTVRLTLRWADVDLAAVRANCARILEHLPKGTRLLAVVKAGGYGHGAIQVARAAIDGGATGVAVATLEEAHAIGGLISTKDILVMGGLTAAQAPDAAAGGWSIGVSSRELAIALAGSGHKVPVHLKIDTGMGRFGSAPTDAPDLARFIDQSPNLELAGTWTHFASSESDDAMTRAQFARFIETIESFEVDPGT